MHTCYFMLYAKYLICILGSGSSSSGSGGSSSNTIAIAFAVTGSIVGVAAIAGTDCIKQAMRERLHTRVRVTVVVVVCFLSSLLFRSCSCYLHDHSKKTEEPNSAASFQCTSLLSYQNIQKKTTKHSCCGALKKTTQQQEPFFVLIQCICVLWLFLCNFFFFVVILCHAKYQYLYIFTCALVLCFVVLQAFFLGYDSSLVHHGLAREQEKHFWVLYNMLYFVFVVVRRTTRRETGIIYRWEKLLTF